jgi:putative transposase
MGHRPKRVLADRAYDATSLRQEFAQRRIEAVVPPNATRKHPHCYKKNAYKGRNVIERMFCLTVATLCRLTSHLTEFSTLSVA